MFLKYIQHLSLGNDVTTSDKNIVIVWLKHIFISKFFAQHIQCISKHTFEIGWGQKQNFINFSSYLSVSTWPKFHIVRHFKGHLV